MKLITTHDTTDFDGLASCVALQKLITTSTIGVPGGFAPNVHKYLALHKDRFPTASCRDLPLGEVDLLVVTDVRRRSRLEHVAPVLERASKAPLGVRTVVWDHHPSAPDDILADEEHVQPVGAVTTIVVEELQARRVTIDREEATLFSLGIHEDTGSLVYSRTGSRDARALAWLLGQGAQPALVQRFLRPPLDPAERSVLVRVLDSLTSESVLGATVGIAAISVEDCPSGLARVTTEAFRMIPEDALFCAYRLPGGKIHLIGRAQTGVVDVGSALSEFDGGGHVGAGSAVVRGRALDEITEALRNAIERTLRHPRVVRDLMSSPVRTVEPTMPLLELAHSLHEWGHTGAPVVDGGKLVGMISRRDVEQAERDGRASLAINSCMAHRIHSIGPEASLTDALELMKRRDIGRLPVLEGSRIVGILSREDVLGVLYEPD